MLRVILLIVVFIASGLVIASQPKPIPVGLYVSFIDGTKNHEKDNLHTAISAKLVYRSSSLPVDTVIIEGDISKEILDKKCKDYKSSSKVKDCEINFKNPPPKAEKKLCPPNPPREKQFDAFNEILNKIELSDPCKLVNKDGLPDYLRPLPDYHDGLTPLWSQEYVGADLSRELVRNYGKTTKIRVGNIDSSVSKKHVIGNVEKGFDWTKIDGAAYVDHGTSTLNLINGKEPIGVSENAVISNIADIYKDPTKGLLPALDEIVKSKPDLVNLEVHTLCQLSACGKEQTFNKPNILRDILKKMGENRIVVAAAGNYYPYGSKRDNSDGLEMILVGNMSPYGIVTHNSDESKNVNIIAPAGDKQMTYNTKGYDAEWGGTSGATPLVTGALADVKSILGELSFNEAKILLEKTALPTSNKYQKPQKNGPGSLNIFGLINVAIKLKEKGWPANRAALINNSEIFDFKKEADSLLKSAKNFLKSDKCDKRLDGMKKLRQSFLLNPSDEAALLLSEAYEKLGYKLNAQYYRNFNKERLKDFLSNPPPIPHHPDPFYYDDSYSSYEKKSIERAKNQLSLD